jgi:hypothetical protein
MDAVRPYIDISKKLIGVDTIFREEIKSEALKPSYPPKYDDEGTHLEKIFLTPRKFNYYPTKVY